MNIFIALRWMSAVEEEIEANFGEKRRFERQVRCNKAPNLSITRKTLCIVRASSFSSRANSPRVHFV